MADAVWANRLKCSMTPVAVFDFAAIGSGRTMTSGMFTAKGGVPGWPHPAFADTTGMFTADEDTSWTREDLTTPSPLQGPALAVSTPRAPGNAVTLQLKLPGAYRVQFTVAGVDQLSKCLSITGLAGPLDVKPAAYPAVAAGGITMADNATSIDLKPVGQDIAGSLDHRAAAQILFDRPVDTIVITNISKGGPAGRWLITRAETCPAALTPR